MGRIDPGATIDRDCRGTSPIESMATSTLATRSPVLNRWLTRPLFKLTIFFLTAAPMTMGAEWEVEYFGTVAEPLRIHWTYQRLPNDGSRYIGLFNDSVCESLTPMILSDDDPSRGIGRLVIGWRSRRHIHPRFLPELQSSPRYQDGQILQPPSTH